MVRVTLIILAVAACFGLGVGATLLVAGSGGHRLALSGAVPAASPTQPALRAPTTAPPVAAAATPTTVPAPTALPSPTVAPTATPVPPPMPVIQSPSNPDPTKWYNVKDVTVTWTTPPVVPIAGYAYSVDQVKAAAAPEQVRTKDDKVTLSDLKDGTWFIHVRAQSTSGQWGPSGTQQVNLDRVPLTITVPKFSAFTFNPRFFKQDVWLDVSRAAGVTATIKNANGQTVRTIALPEQPAGEVDFSWDGKDNHGAIVGAGSYSYAVEASDEHGHTASSEASGLRVTSDRIVVSLSKQSLTAMEGDTPLFSSLVTTGNSALPTPVGVFPILAKYHPFTFHSPWPQGNPFWYADSPVSFAMLFDNAGYFIHDAPWRHDFGPGSNAKLGTPGQDLTGTHGCVNVPLDVETRLFSWAPNGTAVQVVP